MKDGMKDLILSKVHNLLSNGDVVNAKAEIDDIITKYPDLAEAYCYRARLKFMTKPMTLDDFKNQPSYDVKNERTVADIIFNGALSDLDMAVKLDKNCYMAYELGHHYKRYAGLQPEADADLEKARSLEPK